MPINPLAHSLSQEASTLEYNLYGEFGKSVPSSFHGNTLKDIPERESSGLQPENQPLQSLLIEENTEASETEQTKGKNV